MQDVRQIGQEAIKHDMHGRIRAQVMVIVQYEDKLSFNPLQYFIQQHINGALRMSGQFAG
jgi:hypothetical protein